MEKVNFQETTQDNRIMILINLNLCTNLILEFFFQVFHSSIHFFYGNSLLVEIIDLQKWSFKDVFRGLILKK